MNNSVVGLGKRLNQVRKSKGLTAERLSELCGVNSTYLRQIEGGRKLPSLPLFVQLCNVLKVSPSYLLQDAIPHTELDAWPEMAELWENASPGQMKMATNLIKAALESID